MIELVVLFTWHPNPSMVILDRVRQGVIRPDRRWTLHVHSGWWYLYCLMPSKTRWRPRPVGHIYRWVCGMEVCFRDGDLAR